MNYLSDSTPPNDSATDAGRTPRSVWHRVLKWTLGLVGVIGVVVVLAWSALHVFIVPRIASYRATLEQQASQALGLRVEIGSLAVQGSWLVPSLQAQEVRVLDDKGQEVLRMPRVRATVSPRSLAMGEFERLAIEKPELVVRRDAQGHIWVAGMDTSGNGSGRGADWFFSQAQFQLSQGTLHWLDDSLPNASRLTLRELTLSMQNSWLGHTLSAEATPPAAWGQNLKLRGKFGQAPWRRAGDFAHWRGTVFAELPHIDLAALRPWMRLEQTVSLQAGRGALGLRADWRDGQLTGVTADVALNGVDVRWGQDAQALRLRRIQGRVGVQWSGAKVELSSQDLEMQTQDGERWPAGALRVSWQGDTFTSGALQAQRLDLNALAKISQHLPLAASWRASLAQLQPQGQLSQLQLTWQQTHGKLYSYSARGQVRKLSVQRDTRPDSPLASLPGVQGADVTFDLTQAGGKASVRVHKGSVSLPAGLDEPRLAIDEAAAQLAWQMKGDAVAVQFSQGIVANADLTGEFSGNWKTGTGPTRLPGVLDLTAALSRMQVTQVHRYLPNVLPAQVRIYVRDAVQAGEATQVRLRLRGNLNDMPFNDPKLGEFRVAVQLAQGHYAYMPPASAQHTGSSASVWPALTQLNGELVFERSALRFQGRTQLQGAPGVVWHKVDAQIANLADAVVHVSAQAHGPLQQVLDVVAKSALNELTSGVLQQSQAKGEASYQLALTLPLEKIAQAKVNGRVDLADNALQIIPGTPVLDHARGQLQFNESGFSLHGVQAQALGGRAQLQGGLSFASKPSAAPAQLSIKGDLTAEGLRQAHELGFVSRLAQHAKGRLDYSARLGLRRGQPELLITSDLRGMALSLPAPLTKAAAVAMPLRIETQLTRESLQARPRVLQDQIKVSLDGLLSLMYVRDLSTPHTRIVRGAIAVGAAAIEAPPMRDDAVGLNVHLPLIDLDAWNATLTALTGTSPLAPIVSPPRLVGHAFEGGDASGYLPSLVALQTDTLKLSDRLIHNVVLNGTQKQALWRMNISADELNGSIEVRPPDGDVPALLSARLAYLNIPPSSVPDVERMLSEQPSSIPTLDIVVSDLTLRGKKLGRLEIDAVNRISSQAAREWHLNKLKLITPDATLSATGSWIADGPRLRRTALNFALDVRDSGALLTRLGTPNAVRDGEGRLTGQLTWQGSPITLDYASMTGSLNLAIEKGQFLKTEPGAARLLGVLNLQALPRRLSLDFSDLFSDGFAFDFVRGDVRIDQGVAFTNNLQMKGVVAGALMEGSADLARETQDLKVVVVPEINAGTAALYMATINPMVGLTSYLAQLILSRPLVRAGTTEFHVDGTWANPRVVKVD